MNREAVVGLASSARELLDLTRRKHETMLTILKLCRREIEQSAPTKTHAMSSEQRDARTKRRAQLLDALRAIEAHPVHVPDDGV